jgi:hypothetical protein
VRHALLVVAGTLLGLGGCDSCGDAPAEGSSGGVEAGGPTCTVVITAGRGTQTVSEPRAGRSEKAMRKLLFEKGCAKICEADGVASDAMRGCVARCRADIVGDQVGVRFRCDG